MKEHEIWPALTQRATPEGLRGETRVEIGFSDLQRASSGLAHLLMTAAFEHRPSRKLQGQVPADLVADGFDLLTDGPRYDLRKTMPGGIT